VIIKDKKTNTINTIYIEKNSNPSIPLYGNIGVPCASFGFVYHLIVAGSTQLVFEGYTKFSKPICGDMGVSKRDGKS
jgi:hypothetical protein